jgi:phosphoribosylformylglycinamidine cyclo-ligase
LARRILFDRLGLTIDSAIPEVGATVAQALLAEHRSYLGPLSGPLAQGAVEGLAHITGGGITDNLPRILPQGTAARITKGSWPVPALFRFLQQAGAVDDAEMYRTFNMGIGMIVVVRPERAREVEAELEGTGEAHFRIGTIVQGDGKVAYA